MEATITKPRLAYRDAGSEMQRWAAESGFGPWSPPQFAQQRNAG